VGEAKLLRGVMWEDAEALLMAFEAEQDATKAGRPFSRLRVPYEPMSEASRAAFDRLMKERDITPGEVDY
jgi:hypothetical protein